MSTDLVDPQLDKIRSHAINLHCLGRKILDAIDTFDAGRLADAREKTEEAEETARGLSKLITDRLEDRA